MAEALGHSRFRPRAPLGYERRVQSPPCPDCGGTSFSPLPDSTFGKYHLARCAGCGHVATLPEPKPEDLAAIGVPVKHALPGVGYNFRDHYAIRVSALVKGASSLNERSRGLRLVGEVLHYAIARKGLPAGLKSR